MNLVQLKALKKLIQQNQDKIHYFEDKLQPIEARLRELREETEELKKLLPQEGEAQ